jgi:hypothetical protein
MTAKFKRIQPGMYEYPLANGQRVRVMSHKHLSKTYWGAALVEGTKVIEHEFVFNADRLDTIKERCIKRISKLALA